MSTIKYWTSLTYESSNTHLTHEDSKILHTTIEKFGKPQDCAKLNLPGPEITLENDPFSLRKRFLNFYRRNNSSVRTIIDDFSYIGRFEKSEVKKSNRRQIPIVRGQFGEHFKREGGGYYVRIIGYTLDEGGYRQFLVDICKVYPSAAEQKELEGKKEVSEKKEGWSRKKLNDMWKSLGK